MTRDTPIQDTLERLAPRLADAVAFRRECLEQSTPRALGVNMLRASARLHALALAVEKLASGDIAEVDL